MTDVLINKEYFRSILFGIEDSLVSTTGLIAGISVGSSDNREFVLLAGLVAVSIEAVSMGAGEYLSDDAVRDLDKLKRYRENPFLSGTLMLISYFLAGLIPLAPIAFTNYPASLWLSVFLALIFLFLLGFVKGRISNTSPFKGGLKILFVGGISTLLGLVVGRFFSLI
ncbi:MAG TPA: VIT1/CCC1 transporter family protein [Patescibacteria group bacterium]